MIRVLLILFILAGLMSSAAAENFFYARITFYTDDPKYGKKTASGKIAQEGKTVAAAKRKKFGTKLRIPALTGVVGDGNFLVQDRGPALEKRIASKGKLPVIDVYVTSKAKVNKLKKLKLYKVKVYVK